MNDTYGIAELAREFNVTTRTIRFYEDQGLLSPEREGQRRVYSPRERVRLRLIMRGKRLGFSLDDIHKMIDLYDDDPSEIAQLKLFLDKIRERKAVLTEQQNDIAAILKELDKLETENSVLLHKKEAAE